MSTWPSTLPAPTVDGYSIEPFDQTIRTDMESGAARTRRRTRARMDMINVAWKFTDTQMSTFRAWFENDSTGAAGGAGWFTVSLNVGDGGITSKEARFNGVFKPNLLSKSVWNVTATLEVR